MTSKYFFEHQAKQLDYENKTYKAYHESTKLDMQRCNHSRAEIINGELHCPCGNAWSAPAQVLLEIQKQLQHKTN